jgi:hypothetical protein
MGLCAAGLLLFSFISIDFPLPLIVVGLAVVGVGFGLFSSPNTNAIMSCVTRSDYGVTSSIIATMRTGFIVFTVICAVGVFCSVYRSRGISAGQEAGSKV